MTQPTDGEIWFFAFYFLLLIVVTYAWLTRAQRAPGRHRIPDPPEGAHPYDGPLMELSDFPGFPELGQLSERVAPSRRERLATTGELRAMAYDGDMDAIGREVAGLMAALDSGDWTTAA